MNSEFVIDVLNRQTVSLNSLTWKIDKSRTEEIRSKDFEENKQGYLWVIFYGTIIVFFNFLFGFVRSLGLLDSTDSGF